MDSNNEERKSLLLASNMADSSEYTEMREDSSSADAGGGVGVSGNSPRESAPRDTDEGPSAEDAELRRGLAHRGGHEEEEIDEFEAVTSILKPVALTMIVVIWLVCTLGANQQTNTGFSAVMPYKETSSDSDWDKLFGASLNALLLVVMIVFATLIVVCLFKYRCTKVLYGWLSMSVFLLLGMFGGYIFYLLIETFAVKLDWVTFAFLLYNFALVGVVTVLWHSPPFVKQCYLVAVSCIMAWSFTKLPEWTTWAILGAVAAYDVCAVLTPKGPLKYLVETAQKRQEPIPGLVYESRVIKLGLGDFIFYSVLVGRAAMFDLMVAFVCFLAVLMGLCATLLCLAIYQKALPALPISIALGIATYFASVYALLPYMVTMGTQQVFV